MRRPMEENDQIGRGRKKAVDRFVCEFSDVQKKKRSPVLKIVLCRAVLLARDIYFTKSDLAFRNININMILFDAVWKSTFDLDWFSGIAY